MIIGIAALALVILSAILPYKKGRLEIGPATVPPLVIAVLLAAGYLTPASIGEALAAPGGGGAWQILIIFFCVAYISTSTDVTGIFDFTAYRLVLAVGGSGITLMLGVYLFASVLTIFTSNDIVILTLTPILFHVGRHARIDVKPLLFAEFFGANTLSMLLVVGNPTNIIISRTMGIGFVEYTRVMWPSTLTAFFLTGALLLLVFRRSIPRRIELHPDAMFHIRNRLDAGLSTAMMAATFAAFVLSDR